MMMLLPSGSSPLSYVFHPSNLEDEVVHSTWEEYNSIWLLSIQQVYSFFSQMPMLRVSLLGLYHQ